MPSDSEKNLTEASKFRSVSLFTIFPDEPLPFRLAIFYKGKHIIFRLFGQGLEGPIYNRFVYKRIYKILIPEEDFSLYLEYQKLKKEELDRALNSTGLSSEQRAINKMLHDIKEATIKIFFSEDDTNLEEGVLEALQVSKNTVETVLSKPYLQAFDLISYRANSIVDHSMRTSVLGTFVGFQLGFVNPMALEHIATAGLLHDMGKARLNLGEELDFEKEPELESEVMKQHPIVSCDMLNHMTFIPQEVLRIIREHHEARDGSGYPAKIRGPKMYGMSRVFVIVNTFDNLASTAKGDKKQRSLIAAKTMLTDLKHCFDTALLPKAMKVLTHQLKK